MKKTMKCLAIFLSIVAIVAILWPCFTANTPPSYRYISMCFERDKQDLLFIKEYIIDSEVANFCVNDIVDEEWKVALVDLERVKICDEAILAALQRLKEKGYEAISKFGNTVEFRLWEGIRPIGCGIAFAAQGSEIDIEFVTETDPLSENDWYYYVSDYNEWRKTEDETQGTVLCIR